MGLIVVDAGVLIGFLDSNDAHHEAADEVLHEAIERTDRLVLPASAYADILVGPARRGATAVTTAREMTERVPIEVLPLDAAIAEAAARLRAAHKSLKLPDALVIATADVVEADQLVTTDRGWPAATALGTSAQITVL